ncbi:hypothetical protein OEZ49_03865 [Ruegeria sp. WL0004]|uniref:Uncharacterized protein n=1 Tax=Ruegeria marisflavi TaxID=2984152 RepID=A0ABT2WS15_9RHOB|nr:hypothetical protein [Ruegeria sp. WL0004]
MAIWQMTSHRLLQTSAGYAAYPSSNLYEMKVDNADALVYVYLSPTGVNGKGGCQPETSFRPLLVLL